MIIDSWTFSRDELEEQFQSAKHAYLDYLFSEEIIDKETYEDLVSNTAIILRKPSFFSSLWKRKKKEEYILIVVEQRSLNESNELEKKEENADS